MTINLATQFRGDMSESRVAVGDSQAAQDKENQDAAELEAAAQEARKREAARQRKAQRADRGRAARLETGFAQKSLLADTTVRGRSFVLCSHLLVVWPELSDRSTVSCAKIS